MPTTGKHIGQKKQNECKIILSGTCWIILHNNIPDYLPGLSSSNRQTLDKIGSQQPTQANEAVEAADFDQGDWADVDNGQPMDYEIAVSGEGEEIQILLERSGV